MHGREEAETTIHATKWTLPLAFLTVSMTAGCAGDSASIGLPIVVQDSSGVAIVTSDPTRVTATCPISTEPDLTIGIVDGAPEYQLFRVFGARRLSDGRIALVDQGSRQLRIYDADGRFLSASGREGEGPGEFRNNFHLWILPGDTIWVGDYAPWEFEIFAPDGTWVRNLRPLPYYANPPSVLALLDDGRPVLAATEAGDAPMGRFATLYNTVVLHGADGVIEDTIGRYPVGTLGRLPEWPMFIARTRFESSSRIAASGSRIFVAHNSTPGIEVFEAGPDGSRRLDRIIRWTTIPEPVTRSDVEAEFARIEEAFVDAEPMIREQLVAPQLDERIPVASTFPVFAGITVGRDGRIWVRGYPRPGTDAGNDWLVFGADGGLECHARIPTFAQMAEFGDDYLLVLQRDEMGIERVLRYRVGVPVEGG